MNDEIFATPEAAAGRNMPDWAAEESARLEREHEGLKQDVARALEEARGVPPEVADEETANVYTRVIKRLRDLGRKVEALRVMEKQPHLRKEDAVDSFFFRLAERLERRKRTDSPGGVDVLVSRLDHYNQKRLAEEKARREAVARAAREEEARAAREREEAERKRREADAAAARARNADKIKEREAEAAQAADDARRARDAEQRAREAVQISAAEAAAKPADMARERHASGALNTMKLAPHVEIVDAMELDAAALWPFVPEAAKLQALRAWAKVTQHKRQMKGAVIEIRSETVVM